VLAVNTLVGGERNLDGHQWDKLLPSMRVCIPNVSLGNGARDGELEGERVLTLKEAHSLHRTCVEFSKHLCIQALRCLDESVPLLVSKHNVKGQEERSSVLTV